MTTKATALARLGAAARALETSNAQHQAITRHALLDAVDAGASLTELGEQMVIPRQTVRHRIKAARAATGRTKRPEKETK